MASKRQKTLSQTLQNATKTPTIFVKHNVEAPKGDDAKGFLDRFRRDTVDAHRRANQTPSQLVDSAEESEDDDDDFEEDEPESTAQQVEGAGLRYTAILRTRLLMGSMLAPEQLNGLFEVLLLAAAAGLPLVATEASSVLLQCMSQTPLTTCMETADGPPLLCEYRSYWDPILAPYNCHLICDSPAMKGSKQRCFLLMHYTLQQLAAQPSSACWDAVARALAAVLLPDLEARMQWLQRAEKKGDVEGTQSAGVLRGAYLYRAITHEVPRSSTHDHDDRSRESLLRLLASVVVGFNPATKQAGVPGAGAATARELLQGLLRLTGALESRGLYIAPHTSGSNHRLDIDTTLVDCLYSTTACVVDDAQRLALLRALEPQDRVIAKRYSLNAGDVKHFAALEHARRCIEERGRAGLFELDLACVFEYCSQRAGTAARILNGWASLVTLCCALLAAVVEAGDLEGLAVARRCGPQLLDGLREHVAKHGKEQDMPRLQWTLACTQGLVGSD